jgi:hypothetical protein
MNVDAGSPGWHHRRLPTEQSQDDALRILLHRRPHRPTDRIARVAELDLQIHHHARDVSPAEDRVAPGEGDKSIDRVEIVSVRWPSCSLSAVIDLLGQRPF